MEWPFVPHQRYVRRSDIHGIFGGNQQSGMVSLPRFHALFLFTGSGGALANYADRFQPDGTFRYTGEGQSGDQRFTRGNLVLRDHATLGYDVLLFEKVGTSPSVTFLGQFVCASYEIERQRGRDAVLRDAIVFELTPLEAVQRLAAGEPLSAAADLQALRARAYAAAAPARRKDSTPSRSIYHRSDDVKGYVLARASGLCEACGNKAPFITTSGAPYLEPHHIDRLSDGGPDSPHRVAAICPNCHREAHHGSTGANLNARLRAHIEALESRLGVI